MTDKPSDLLRRYSEEAKLEAHVAIPPHLLRYQLHHVIRDRLARNIRGKCTEKDGFVLQLKRITHGGIRGGVLNKRDGAVHYAVEYIAETLKPRVGDIIEAIATRVFKIGVFADLGPLNIFIPMARLPEEYEFQTLPTASFVVSGDPSKTIRPGSEVRVRLEKIAMLDDNFMPNDTTRCVLKAMGELISSCVSSRQSSRQR